ncbi:unnamed protein product, partial [Adineta steineri]
GKETYRSDLMEFIVPEQDAFKNQETEFITVTNELPPPNLPIVLATKDDIISDVVGNQYHICCNDSPHKEFPGIEHYFRNISNIIPTSPKSLINGNKKSVSFAEKTNDDDDDDVVIS